MLYRIVETDNFDGDYPNESFLPIPLVVTKEDAERIADAINNAVGDGYWRFWKVVTPDYVLVPGFEP